MSFLRKILVLLLRVHILSRYLKDRGYGCVAVENGGNVRRCGSLLGKSGVTGNGEYYWQCRHVSVDLAAMLCSAACLFYLSG